MVTARRANVKELFQETGSQLSKGERSAKQQASALCGGRGAARQGAHLGEDIAEQRRFQFREHAGGQGAVVDAMVEGEAEIEMAVGIE